MHTASLFVKPLLGRKAAGSNLLPSKAAAGGVARRRAAPCRGRLLQRLMLASLMLILALGGLFIYERPPEAAVLAQASPPPAPPRPREARPSRRRAMPQLAVPKSLPNSSPFDASDSPFLFVAIVTGSDAKLRLRRDAVRDAWSLAAGSIPEVALRFVMCEQERTSDLVGEQAEHGDLALIPCSEEALGYRGLVHKTLHVLEHAADAHPGAKFVLKTDDDSFVNVPALLATLQSLCNSPNCTAERLYMGGFITDSKVFLEEGHKWENRAYQLHTGLDRYIKYAFGGGYVLSGDVVRSLVAGHRQGPPLKFTPAEDATLAMWLLHMDLRHVHVPGRMMTGPGWACYVARPGAEVPWDWKVPWPWPWVSPEEPEEAKEESVEGEEEGEARPRAASARRPCNKRGGGTGQRLGRRALWFPFLSSLGNAAAAGPPPVLIKPGVEERLCGKRAWLVLHKVDEPACMRLIGQRVAACPGPARVECDDGPAVAPAGAAS